MARYNQDSFEAHESGGSSPNLCAPIKRPPSARKKPSKAKSIFSPASENSDGSIKKARTDKKIENISSNGELIITVKLNL